MRKKELLKENEKFKYTNERLKSDLEFEQKQSDRLRNDIDELRLLVAAICDTYNIESIQVSEDMRKELEYHFSINCTPYKEMNYKIKINKPKKVGRPNIRK